jgi:hypothetical protein
MGSYSRDPYLVWCDNCVDYHPTKHRAAEADKAWTKIADLPESDYPWIAVRYGDVVIFANEEFAPYVLHRDGRLEIITSHVPSTGVTQAD